MNLAIAQAAKERGVTSWRSPINSEALLEHLSRVSVKVARAHPDLGRQMAQGKLSLGGAMAIVRQRGGYEPGRGASVRPQTTNPVVDPSKRSKQAAPSRAKDATPAGDRVVDPSKLAKQTPSVSKTLRPAAVAAITSPIISRQFAGAARTFRRR